MTKSLSILDDFAELPLPKRVHVSDKGNVTIMCGRDGADYGPDNECGFLYGATGKNIDEAMVILRENIKNEKTLWPQIGGRNE